ncbi:heparinase II/III domain-containing protein, partial [Ectopseudomonas hydrolytica]|uniref:heparinase II/III domain-containing protein n=1 Tax=Ectopseudomonas hydrolytica TaxID=2493633 RepID=UPI003EE34083
MSTKHVYQVDLSGRDFDLFGSGRIEIKEDVVVASMSGKKNTYVLGCSLPCSVNGSGVSVRIFLGDWHSIDYAAVGYTYELGYRHVKASNICQDAWIDFGFTHQDVIWKLQNGSEGREDADIGDVRIVIKGQPSAKGAVVKVSSFAVLMKGMPANLPRQPLDKRLLETLHGYLRKGFREYQSNAKVFMETGKCPMPGGKLLDWPSAALKPDTLESVNTFRFAWHGLHPVINLLLSAEQTGAVAPVFAARAFVDNWLDQSYYVLDDDSKFTWYDHGTAERLLAFILMWAKAVEFGLDERFMQRLNDAIYSHAQLLNSEAFYAYHQPHRYHNHAWFQDAALTAVALAFPDCEESQQWLANAISRFEDQLDKLIVRDGGFAIFVENSIGYHHGVQRLAELVGALVELSGQTTEIPTVAKELIAWSDFLRYPDGRVPAQGDTFRLPARTGAEIRRGIAWSHPGCTVLPKAGYAVVKGNHDGKPWMLCLFNTSLSKTHKHEDNLSITFWFDGIEWLIDPSFYSHEYAEVTSSYLRSAKAHNVIVSEATGYSIEPGRAQLTDISSGNIYGVVATSLCVEGLEMRRSVSYRADDSALDFQDAVLPLNGGAPAAARLNYVFGENVCCETQKTGFVLSHPDSIYRLAFDFDGEVSVTSLKTCAGLGFMQACEVGGAVVSCGESNHLGWKLSLQGDSSQGEEGRSSEGHGISTSGSKLGKVLLIGSCVTRDALSLIECEEIKYY